MQPIQSKQTLRDMSNETDIEVVVGGKLEMKGESENKIK